MNLPLFIEQLNLLVQADAKPLYGLCDLLRAHLRCGVCVRSSDGSVLVEILAEDGNCELTAGFITLRRNEKFSDNEKLAANIALSICTILVRHREENTAAEKQRRAKAVRAVINSLSFSELGAATQIFSTLENNEGLLVAARIADKLGVARSVITGALRKLEGANLIETRSLGMKGTYIRIKNTLLTEELAKL